MSRVGVLMVVGSGCMGYTLARGHSGCDDKPDPQRSPEAVKVLEAKNEAVRAEIAQLEDHAWAGLYVHSDGWVACLDSR